jgi:hypothetical protein
VAGGGAVKWPPPAPARLADNDDRFEWLSNRAIARTRLFRAPVVHNSLNKVPPVVPEGMLRERASQPDRSARFDWDDGSTRVVVGSTAKGEGRSHVALAHERRPDRGAADEARAYWRERMAALKALLEGCGTRGPRCGRRRRARPTANWPRGRRSIGGLLPVTWVAGATTQERTPPCT